ncbi:MAG: porin [Herminiimonas sp.]|nr:porin [Herminiimonas sp.]
MKKTLLSLTVFSAFAGAASAQTNVTVYGLVDIGITRENNGVNSITRMDSGNFYGSRIGFKGTEDLGGGLSASFQLENGFNADTGTLGQGSLLFGRQAWVGLNGGFGSVKFGRQYTPIYNALDTVDPFDTGLTGGWNDTGSGIVSLFNAGGVRMNNTIDYSTTSGPFSGELAYGFGEVAGSTTANRQWGLSGTYASGPVTGVLAYHSTNNAIGTDSTKTTLIGGVYNFGPVKLHAAYAWDKGVGTLDQRDGMIGVTIPVGAGSVLIDYLRKIDKANSNSNAAQLGLGYTYDVSKRTTLYTSYSRNANDSAVSYNAAGNGLTDSLFNVGIRHKF